jgi:hypothetical protein
VAYGEVSATLKGTYQVEAPVLHFEAPPMIGPTCQPFYVSDPQRVVDEIVTTLKAQGYRITKNAIGDHCAAGPVNITRLAEALERVVVRVTMMDGLA